MTTKARSQMKAEEYPFAKELIIDTEGHIRKVVIDFSDYQRLLSAIEDDGSQRRNATKPG